MAEQEAWTPRYFSDGNVSAAEMQHNWYEERSTGSQLSHGDEACCELITRELQILLKLSFLEDVSADLTKPQHNPLPPTPKPSALSGGVGELPSALCLCWGWQGDRQ